MVHHRRKGGPLDPPIDTNIVQHYIRANEEHHDQARRRRGPMGQGLGGPPEHQRIEGTGRCTQTDDEGEHRLRPGDVAIPFGRTLPAEKVRWLPFPGRTA